MDVAEGAKTAEKAGNKRAERTCGDTRITHTHTHTHTHGHCRVPWRADAFVVLGPGARGEPTARDLAGLPRGPLGGRRHLAP